jgi:hypothetical protein
VFARRDRLPPPHSPCGARKRYSFGPGARGSGQGQGQDGAAALASSPASPLSPSTAAAAADGVWQVAVEEGTGRLAFNFNSARGGCGGLDAAQEGEPFHPLDGPTDASMGVGGRAVFVPGQGVPSPLLRGQGKGQGQGPPRVSGTVAGGQAPPPELELGPPQEDSQEGREGERGRGSEAPVLESRLAGGGAAGTAGGGRRPSNTEDGSLKRARKRTGSAAASAAAAEEEKLRLQNRKTSIEALVSAGDGAAAVLRAWLPPSEAAVASIGSSCKQLQAWGAASIGS